MNRQPTWHYAGLFTVGMCLSCCFVCVCVFVCVCGGWVGGWVGGGGGCVCMEVDKV